MYKRGEILIDREQESEVVVTKIDSRRADEVVINERDPEQNRYSDQTVYNFNARYPYVEPQDIIVHGVYAESLPTDPHELTKEGRTILAQNVVAREMDVQAYAFPISRLITANES